MYIVLLVWSVYFLWIMDVVIVHVGFWLDEVGVACVACCKMVMLEQFSKI